MAATPYISIPIASLEASHFFARACHLDRFQFHRIFCPASRREVLRQPRRSQYLRQFALSCQPEPFPLTQIPENGAREPYPIAAYSAI